MRARVTAGWEAGKRGWAAGWGQMVSSAAVEGIGSVHAGSLAPRQLDRLLAASRSHAATPPAATPPPRPSTPGPTHLLVLAQLRLHLLRNHWELLLAVTAPEEVGCRSEGVGGGGGRMA